MRYVDLETAGANYARFWTPREDRTLTKLYAENASRKVISERLGRSIDAIRNRAYDLGLTVKRGRDWTPREVAHLKRTWRDGSPTAIGVAIDRPINSIVGKAYRLGLPAKKTSPRAGSRPRGSDQCDCAVGVQSCGFPTKPSAKSPE